MTAFQAGRKNRLNTYGRRRGRKLRPAQKRRLEGLLPSLRIKLTEGQTLDPASLFPEPKRAYWLELGFGAGEHLAWQAKHNPDVGFLGAEFYVNGVAAALRHIEEAKLKNIFIFQGDGRLLLEALPDRSLERLFILFPDPWPKSRHTDRRLVSFALLECLRKLMLPGGLLRFASDEPRYLSWALAQFGKAPGFVWKNDRPDDWKKRPPDWPATRYEQKAVAQGRQPCFFEFVLGDRVEASIPIIIPKSPAQKPNP